MPCSFDDDSEDEFADVEDFDDDDLDEHPASDDIERLDHEGAHCPECGAEVWDAADICPKCYAYIGGDTFRRRRWPRVVAWLLIAAFVIGLAIALLRVL